MTWLLRLGKSIYFIESEKFESLLSLNGTQVSCKDEYRKLEQVYNQLKDEIWGFSLDFKKAAFCLSKGGTLTEDLNHCMNKKEKEKYLSHLFVL